MAYHKFSKVFLSVILMSLGMMSLSACSTNPATGATQFAGLMSPAQENRVGADEHPKIVAQFGLYDDPQINNYVQKIGARVTANTERPDVQYRFFVLDSPIVNAFALPGGYIYVSRGLVALANSEAELAAVLAHEAGHITGRHSAARYSRSVVTQVGATILATAVNQPGVSQALNLGSNLYLSSYSRGQENEADTLGIRYLERAGYDPRAMTWFLESLKASSELESRIDGKTTAAQAGYFSTHPATQSRVVKTRSEAAQFEPQGTVGQKAYLDMINGLTYGDNTHQGFAREDTFYHPDIGFAYDVPDGFRIKNSSRNVAAFGPGGTVLIFDMDRRNNQSASDYLQRDWFQNQRLTNVERVSVNGMNAATASFRGQINNVAMVIRVMAIEFDKDRFARFQIGIPQNLSGRGLDDLKRATYSFRRLSTAERAQLKPNRIRVVVASKRDTVQSLAAKQAVNDNEEAYFRVINGLRNTDTIKAGELYKIISR